MLEVFFLTASKVGMLLLFIAIGYCLRRLNKLPEDTGKTLSLLATTLFAPAYTLSNLSQNLTRDVLGEKLLLILWGAVFVLAAITLAFFLSKPFARNRVERSSLIYAFAIPNYGYFGYPVIEGVFGAAMLADAIVFMIPLAVTANSVGYLLFSKEKKLPWKKLLLSPMLLGILIGALIGLTEIQLPAFVSDALSKAGSCMSPCSMLLAGFLMGKFPLKKLLSGWRPYVLSAIRLIGIPLVFGSVLWLCGVRGQYLLLPVLSASLPLGLNLVVFPESQGHEKEASDNAKLCFVSFLLVVLVLPVTFAILTHLAV